MAFKDLAIPSTEVDIYVDDDGYDDADYKLSKKICNVSASAPTRVQYADF